MSSILKVDTIQDQNGNLIISKDSGGSGFLSPYASSSAAITYTVTVASKTSAHPYFGVGSSLGYLINGIESPIIEIKGNDTSKPYHYKFDQSDSSNSGHPLLFYNNVGKTTQFTTGVTTNGTPGSSGAYTMIAVDSQTPNILYYQCSSHGNMGNHTFATSPVVNTGVFLTLPTADGSSGQVVTTNGSGVLSFASAVPADGSISTAKIADDAVTTDKLANSINSAITANTAKVTNATHSGEVTGATALTIADDIVDEANLKVSNSPTNGYYLSAQSGNTGGLTWAEVAAGGITGADSWRLTSSFSGSASTIQSNLERVDTDGYGTIGSAMTVSSGIFTFPTTGIWLIEATFFTRCNGDNRAHAGGMSTTTNNSSYSDAAGNYSSMYNSGNDTYSNSKCSFIFDVTSTSTHKVMFYVSTANSSSVTAGDTNSSLTAFTFIRLGDT